MAWLKESPKSSSQTNILLGTARTKRTIPTIYETLGKIVPSTIKGFNFSDKSGEKTIDHPDNNFNLYLDIYQKVPVAKNAVDNISNFAIQSGYELDGTGKERVEKFIDEFNFDNLLLNILRQMLIYGNAYLELDASEGKINAMKLLPPNQMFVVVHTGKGNDGELKGYKQVVDSTREAITFTPEQIVHFKWNEIGPAFYGISDLKASVGTLHKLLNYQDNLGKILDRYANVTMHHKLGTEERPPSASDIDAYKELLNNQEAGEDLVTSYTVEINPIAADLRMIQPDGILKHLENQLISSLGVPEIFIRGGETSNKATADVELQAFDRRVKALRSSLAELVEDKIFKIYGDVKISWREMSIVEESVKAKMVKDLADASVSPETSFDIVGWGNWKDELKLVVPPSNEPNRDSDQPQEPKPKDFENDVEYLKAWTRYKKGLE